MFWVLRWDVKFASTIQILISRTDIGAPRTYAWRRKTRYPVARTPRIEYGLLQKVTINSLRLERFPDAIDALAFTPDFQRIVTEGGDGLVRIWDADTEQEVCHPLTGREDAVDCVVMRINGNQIVSGSLDMTVRLWNAERGTETCRPLLGHENAVTCAAINHNGLWSLAIRETKQCAFGILRLGKKDVHCCQDMTCNVHFGGK